MVELRQPILCSSEADPEAFDLAEPALAFGLGDSGGQVVADFLQQPALGRVCPQERTSDTGVVSVA